MSFEKEQLASRHVGVLIAHPLSIGAFSSVLENIEETPSAWFLLKLMERVRGGRDAIGKKQTNKQDIRQRRPSFRACSTKANAHIT